MAYVWVRMSSYSLRIFAVSSRSLRVLLACPGDGFSRADHHFSVLCIDSLLSSLQIPFFERVSWQILLWFFLVLSFRSFMPALTLSFLCSFSLSFLSKNLSHVYSILFISLRQALQLTPSIDSIALAFQNCPRGPWGSVATARSENISGERPGGASTRRWKGTSLDLYLFGLVFMFETHRDRNSGQHLFGEKWAKQIAKLDKNETDPLEISRDCHWYNLPFFMICHYGWVHVHPQAQEKQYLSLSVPSFPGKALGFQFFRTSFLPHVKKKSKGECDNLFCLWPWKTAMWGLRRSCSAWFGVWMWDQHWACPWHFARSGWCHKLTNNRQQKMVRPFCLPYLHLRWLCSCFWFCCLISPCSCFGC